MTKWQPPTLTGHVRIGTYNIVCKMVGLQVAYRNLDSRDHSTKTHVQWFPKISHRTPGDVTHLKITYNVTSKQPSWFSLIKLTFLCNRSGSILGRQPLAGATKWPPCQSPSQFPTFDWLPACSKTLWKLVSTRPSLCVIDWRVRLSEVLNFEIRMPINNYSVHLYHRITFKVSHNNN